MKHTPGPWKATRNASFSYSIGTDYVHDRGHDCNVVREVRCEANAFLVAAAPELLQVMNEFLELDPPCPFRPEDGRYKEWFATWEKMHAAIRKAKEGAA